MSVLEDDLVRKIGAAASSGSRASKMMALGMGDDAALFAPRAGKETILTCDWFLEGTHFLRGKHPPDAVGWKCLARAVSDIAAMGGSPRCFLLSLALPGSHTGKWLTEFLAGLRRSAHRLGCQLAGGDTTQRPEILINIAVAGEVARGRALRRSGARPGDVIFVSGTLGEAERGLQRLRTTRGQARTGDPLLRKHLYPEPRIALGEWLAQERLATAAMDLSDGLSSDLPRLCASSAVGAMVESAALPAIVGEPEAEALRWALHGGDDYELLFTVARKNARRIPKKYRGLALTAIGTITRGRSIVVRPAEGSAHRLRRGGWDPFR